jgi:hypothetical protein
MYVNLYTTLFIEEDNKCKKLTVLPRETDRSNDKKYPIVLRNKLNSKFVYRRGYPRRSPCEAGRICGAVPRPRHSTQETYLTVYQLYFRYNIKGTASSPLHRYLTATLPLTEEEVQPGWDLNSATVRIISAVVSIHRRG